MSGSAERRHRSNRTQPQRPRITQVETEVRALRRRDRMQRQRLAEKYGHEFLALIDSNRNCKVVVIDIVQKVVFQDEEGMLFLKLMGLWWASLLR